MVWTGHQRGSLRARGQDNPVCNPAGAVLQRLQRGRPVPPQATWVAAVPAEQPDGYHDDGDAGYRGGGPA